MSPQKLGREWIEQQEIVLLGEDPNQNEVTDSCLYWSSPNPPEKGEEAETQGLGVLSQPQREPRSGVMRLLVHVFE